eukprot:CAMPEP_0116836542 /NCGR_PEP_ID=MMETSP0418-20121206/8156_1 /TAXON_ID=1158023 /ORGANISM="Astrosyne radiata, Strain 13vi08-1A" /LENGTH=373 /DNA_ID=CAMNT_0004466327 /DNA_START=545 /DNA_END=1666 /DNA_ORIENTATION=+
MFISGLGMALIWFLLVSKDLQSSMTKNSMMMMISTSSSSSSSPSLNLRFNWSQLELQSPIAKRMWQHQSNCSLPNGNYMLRKKMFGLGSDLHVWGAALCNAMEEGVRMRTYHYTDSWVWLNREVCGSSNASVMTCYFPRSELLCPQDWEDPPQEIHHDVANPIHVKCNRTMQRYNKSDWRASGIELLFTHVSDVVMKEAQRQLNLVFGDKVPEDLITVHMRWGDKKFENRLHGVLQYVRAVEEIKSVRGDANEDAHIFLSTEDPAAVEAFRKMAPRNWKIYLDQMYHEMLPHRPTEDMYNKVPHTSRKLNGKVGLWSLGSLLVAMEANAFVLTRTSNWSRLMDEIRKNILNPRCNDCTFMVDLSRDDPKFKEW